MPKNQSPRRPFSIIATKFPKGAEKPAESEFLFEAMLVKRKEMWYNNS